MITLYDADNGRLDGAPDGCYCEWHHYEELDDQYDAALDALQEMCRRDCSWQNGYYDSQGSRTLLDALDVLVAAGRLVWIHGDRISARCIAKDKEAQG